MKRDIQSLERMEIDDNDDNDDHDDDDENEQFGGDSEMDVERRELEGLLKDYNYAMTVPAKKLPTNLFDLKNLFQVNF